MILTEYKAQRANTVTKPQEEAIVSFKMEWLE